MKESWFLETLRKYGIELDMGGGGMDLKVGDKAIIVNSQHHSEYNFQKCIVKSIDGHKISVFVPAENYDSKFWVKRNELIPLTYQNCEEYIKNGVNQQLMIELFNEYKAYYECLCKAADEVGADCTQKDDEINYLKVQNNQLMDENARLKEQLEYVQCKLQQTTEQGESEKLKIAVDVLSCRLAERQKGR